MIAYWINNYFLISLFVSMLSVGELALIPGVYLGYMNSISLWYILAVALAGSIVSDTVWYLVGRYVPKGHVIRRRMLRKKINQTTKLQPFYEKHKLWTIFFCKFLYGTTIFFQTLAGFNKTPYFTYITISILSTMIWFLGATILGLVLSVSIGKIHDLAVGAGIVATITLATGIISYIVVSMVITRRSGP